MGNAKEYTEVTETAGGINVVKSGDPARDELLYWWITTAVEDFDKTVPKMEEYGGSGSKQGSADLRIIGANQAELLGWDGVDDAIAQELGVWFYAQGKLARLIPDYQNRQMGKPDTWFDATVYCLMARRIQHAGVWP